MNISEIWRPVVGYEGLYEVSNLGGVRSLDRFIKCRYGEKRLIKGMIKLSHLTHKGYLQVSLWDGNVEKHITVHRLVADAFPEICGTWFPGAQIDHRDGNKLNNRPENLWYCTASQNQRNPISRTNQIIAKKMNSKSVIRLTTDGAFLGEYPSAREAERQTGIHNGSISRSCQSKSKTAGGYRWAYKEDWVKMKEGAA